MKKQVRRSVFETNSSSVHTIVVKHRGCYKMKLKRSKKDHFAVIGRCRDYSEYGIDGNYVLTTQQEKFEYVLSLITYKRRFDGYNIEESWEFRNLLRAITSIDNTVDMIIVKDKGKANFDHQTAPNSYSDGVVDLYNENRIRDFIFNDNITLNMSFD